MMKKPSSFRGFIVTVSLGLAVAGGLMWQRFETAVLRSELDAARMNGAELSRLEMENQRLRQKQISAAELEQLRADHAALPRLRAELEALEKQQP